MIYQLAKTTPLLTGQVKMNLILNGDKVINIQYTPISNNITFNYNNPVDVLNYSHGDNVKMLYNKISDSFFSDIHRPELSVNQLHRYDTFTDDTHENTYEMGMKRLEYQRYKKQFEFFCPIWCDNTDDLKNVKFVINLANQQGRVMYKREINFSDKIKTYIESIYKSLNFEDNKGNLDLVYINFDEMQSHIKGLNVESGTLQTVDTSYIVNNLLYQERPVLETDNMIVSLFGNNKIICTQIFNFNFLFNLEDFIPIYMLNNFISERINVYVDVYSNNIKCDVKDFYTNYEFIPKYDLGLGEYSNTSNVLDYLQDNKSIELINKNKLVQSTFHWVLQNNRKSIFNLYNGFSPINNGKNVCSSISNDAPDMFTDVFDENKNPLGVFKFTNLCNEKITNVEFVNTLKKDIYHTFSLENLNSQEYQFFGNVLISNQKLSEYIQDSKEKINNSNINNNLDIKTDFCVYPSTNSSNIRYDDYSNSNYKIKVGNNAKSVKCILSTDIKQVNCAIIKIPNTYGYAKLRNLLDSTYLLTELEYVDYSNKSAYNSCGSSILGVKYEKIDDSKKYLYIIVFIHEIDDFVKRNISFRNLYDTDFVRDLIDLKQECKNFYDYPYSDSASKKKILNNTYISQKRMCYNALNLIASIIKCAKLPNDIVFDKSFSYTKTDSPSIKTTEVELLKIDKFVELYRYDTNIIPMFIDLDDNVFRNNIYWCKQYDKSIQNQLNSGKSDLDGISTYSKYALKKYKPMYNSIGYYVLNSKLLDYENYYLDVGVILDGKKGYFYQKEISWYKNNSFFYLPVYFEKTMKKSSKTGITENDIIDCIYKEIKNSTDKTISKNLVRKYIKNLYEYTYTYDYKSITNISELNFEIKFTLK